MSLGQITPHILALRAVAKSAANMGAGESERFAALWNEAAHVLKRAADDLEAQRKALSDKFPPVPVPPRLKP